MVHSVPISGGSAFRGTANPVYDVDGEGIIERKKLRDFRIDANPVSNQRFEAFVSATGYKTEAECFGWSFVFHLDAPDAPAIPDLNWWRRLDGADWRHPEGPGTSLAGREGHPAVHVSWNDAIAYAKWCGGRLPTEIEWEHAARAGGGDVRFCWGDQEPDHAEFYPCNIWQGRFPTDNSAADGYKRTAPDFSFEPNSAGIHNMLGNVWEWTADAYRIRWHCQVVSGDLRDGCFRCLMKLFRVHSLAKDRKHRIWRGDMILWSGGSGGVGRVC